MNETPTLPPFPVDDFTLNLLVESMDRVVVGFAADDPSQPIIEGCEFSLPQLLDFLSGYDESKSVQAVNEYDQPIPDLYHYEGGPLYHIYDVIKALIAEVRQLRGQS